MNALIWILFGAVFIIIAASIWIKATHPKQSQYSPNLQFNGETYDKADVVRDFLTIAFSNTLWNEDEARIDTSDNRLLHLLLRNFHDSPDRGWAQGLFSAFQFSDQEPWIRQYYKRNIRDFPRHGVINKWSGDITIGVSWPYTGSQVSPSNEAMVHEENARTVIKEQVLRLAPELSELTGRSVRFIDPGDPADSSNKFARIRIVLIRQTEQQNFFKTWRTHGAYAASFSHGSISEGQYALWGGVPFTPLARAQVDGYILPNSANDIGLAVCKIWPVVGDELMKALVTECLARVVGLPEMLQSQFGGILGHWNSAHDPHSLLVALDGKKAVKWGNSDVGPDTAMGAFPKNATDPARLYQEFTPYDRLMISLLYCSNIRSGMDKYAAIFAAESCLNKMN
jgi:hypothetical protein